MATSIIVRVQEPNNSEASSVDHRATSEKHAEQIRRQWAGKGYLAWIVS